MKTRAVAKIQFYNIRECGYYNIDSGDHMFCQKKDMLNGLHQWIQRKEIKNTITFEPREDSDQYNVYCYDFCHTNDQGSLLTTWNGTPVGEDNQLAAVNVFAPLGTDDLETSDFSAGYIPGYETYFWFPHGKKVFATIRFDRRQNGRAGLCCYLQSFLAAHHPSYVFDARDTEHGCFLYGEDKCAVAVHNPEFSAHPTKLPGRIQAIRNNRDRIVKVVRKASLRPLLKAEDETLWQRVLGFAFVSDSPIKEDFVDLETRFRFTPNKSQLEMMISEWMGREKNGEIGVIYRGDPNVHWFDSCLAKGEFPVSVYKNKQGIVKAEPLAQTLAGMEDEIFSRAYAK